MAVLSRCPILRNKMCKNKESEKKKGKKLLKHYSTQKNITAKTERERKKKQMEGAKKKRENGEKKRERRDKRKRKR